MNRQGFSQPINPTVTTENGFPLISWPEFNCTYYPLFSWMFKGKNGNDLSQSLLADLSYQSATLSTVTYRFLSVCRNIVTTLSSSAAVSAVSVCKIVRSKICRRMIPDWLFSRMKRSFYLFNTIHSSFFVLFFYKHDGLTKPWRQLQYATYSKYAITGLSKLFSASIFKHTCKCLLGVLCHLITDIFFN